MSKLVARKKGVKRTVSIGKVAPETAEQVEDLDGRIEAIQWLIPLGCRRSRRSCKERSLSWLGRGISARGRISRYAAGGLSSGRCTWPTRNYPSMCRGCATWPTIPRSRWMFTRHCRRLDRMDEGLLLRMLKGIATRNYEACAEAVPEAFGLSSSSVSRRYVKGTARKLAEFQERSLEGYDLVALFLDGKSFADEEIIIALGVTLDGQKIPLGFVQAATENERVCRRFLSDLVERGMQYEAGLLVVIDGAKGLYKAVMSVLKGHACVQRCQYHKRQNVVSYLSKSEQSGIARWRRPTANRDTRRPRRHWTRSNRA